MLALRLARGARPAAWARRALLTVASGGTCLLILCALGYAMGHPQTPGNALLRLIWCLAPLVATAGFAVAVARSDPGTRPGPGLFAVGLGPMRLTALSAASTALACAAGSVLALLVFLQLRGNLSGLPFDGAADGLLAADRSLPLPALLTLLTVVPVTASVATGVALRPRAGASRPPEADDPADPAHPGGGAAAGRPAAQATLRGALRWGVARVVAGLAAELYASSTDRDLPAVPGAPRAGRAAAGMPPPSGLAHGSLGVLTGWALTALGLALAGPVLTYGCGLLLQVGRPRALRLLAGRILQQEAHRVGRPLGVVCAMACGAFAAVTLYARQRPGTGPLSLLGAVIVAGCTVATLVMAAVEVRRSRAGTTAALLRLGASARLLRGAAALRAVALLVVCAPLTWGVSQLAALPLGG